MARGRALLRAPRRIAGDQTAFSPPNNEDYVRDWSTLAPKEEVLVVANGARELSGHIDAVTSDGAVMWLHLDASAGRRLFARSETVFVWRQSLNSPPT